MSARLIGRSDNGKTWKKLFTLETRTQRQLNRALHQVGSEYMDHTKNLMAEKKTGRIYNIRGIEHQASAPGEAPAILSGTLQRSIFYNARGHLQLVYGATAPYAAYLEDGTTIMEARPSLKRTIHEKRKETINGLRAAWSKRI